MTNTTPIFWEANGLSLHTYAWSIKTFGGRRYTPPTKRGEDLIIPLRRGRYRTRKWVDAQTLSLQMNLNPRNQDGSIDVSLTAEQKLHQNWRTLVSHLDTEDDFELVKRWWDESGDVAVATGRAELMGGFEPTSSNMVQEFTLELVMADPYFYRAMPLRSNAATPFTVEGDVYTDHVTLRTTGTDVKVTFPPETVGGPQNWIQVLGTHSDVAIDLYDCSAFDGTHYLNGAIRRSTSHLEWPVLRPGPTTLTVTGGTASLEYEAAYR